MASDGVVYAREVFRDLREIVEEYGPDTKRECVYVDVESLDPQTNEPVYVPHCIVGEFLYRRGVPMKRLRDLEGNSIISVGHKLDEYMTIDRDALTLLALAQNVQDRGDNWGTALEVVEQELTHPGYYGGAL